MHETMYEMTERQSKAPDREDYEIRPVTGQGKVIIQLTKFAFLLIDDLAMGPIKYQGDHTQQTVFPIKRHETMHFVTHERTKRVRGYTRSSSWRQPPEANSSESAVSKRPRPTPTPGRFSLHQRGSPRTAQ